METTLQGEARLWTLADGRTVAIVPMAADDGARLVYFHEGLSMLTTYRRFFCVHPELSDAEVHHLTHVDHRNRDALVAVAEDEIVGVARLERLADPATAEVAFVVADPWQGVGLGTLLFERLAARARQLGITAFTAETLPGNEPMLAVFRRAGGLLRIADGVIAVTIAV